MEKGEKKDKKEGPSKSFNVVEANSDFDSDLFLVSSSSDQLLDSKFNIYVYST